MANISEAFENEKRALYNSIENKWETIALSRPSQISISHRLLDQFDHTALQVPAARFGTF